MKKYKLMWYDQNSTKKTDIVEAENIEEATKKGYLMYNGNPPSELVSVVEIGGETD